MKINNNGSISGTILSLVIKMLLLLVIMIVIYAIIAINLSKNVENNDIQKEIIKSRILYSPECVIYSENNKSYPGIIALNKLTEDKLSKCFENAKLFGMNITLVNNDIQESNLIYNKDIYDFKFSCKLNKPKYNCIKTYEYVLFRYDNGTISFGELSMDMVISK